MGLYRVPRTTNPRKEKSESNVILTQKLNQSIHEGDLIHNRILTLPCGRG